MLSEIAELLATEKEDIAYMSAETEQEQKKFFLTDEKCYNYKEYQLHVH